MADAINFKSLEISVSVTSPKDPRRDFALHAVGNDPPDHFSLRPKVMIDTTDKLVALKEVLGEPPSDLRVDILETWSA